MDDSLRELYQDVILDHSRHPRHFGPLPAPTHTAEGHNPLCGDRVKIFLQVDDQDHIREVTFQGRGCAISVASASLMTDMVKGRTVAEAEQLMGGFLSLVKGEDTKNPLSDKEIVEILSQRGIPIARRTVAKYRNELNILPSNMRKEF